MFSSDFSAIKVNHDTPLAMKVSNDTKYFDNNAVAVEVLLHLQKKSSKVELWKYGIPYVENYVNCDGHFALTMPRTPKAKEWTKLGDESPSEKPIIMEINLIAIYEVVSIELNLKSFQINVSPIFLIFSSSELWSTYIAMASFMEMYVN